MRQIVVILCVLAFLAAPLCADTNHVLPDDTVSPSVHLRSADNNKAQYEVKPVSHWIDRLENGSVQERMLASHALERIGWEAKDAAPALTKALHDSNEHVRRNSANALSNLGKAAHIAVPDLIEALKDDTDADLRHYAARALSSVGPDAVKAVPALVRALDDPDRFVREESAAALGMIGTRDKEAIMSLRRLLRDSDLYVRRSASRALGSLAPVAIPYLIEGLRDKNLEFRFRTAEALRYMGIQALPALSEGLEEEDPHIREGCARALVVMRPRPVEAVASLKCALGDKNIQVRVWVARALGWIGLGAEPAASQLVESLDSDSIEFRHEVVLALARIGPGCQPLLTEALTNESPLIRAGAARALGLTRPAATNSILALIAMLRDDNCDVRFEAAQGLSGIGAEAIPHLRTALADNDSKVRAGAAYALGGRCDGGSIAFSHLYGTPPEAEVRKRIKEAVDALRAALRDTDRKVRRTSAEALGRLGEFAKSALTDLEQSIRDDSDPSVRYRAAKALARIDKDSSAAHERVATELARRNRIEHFYGFEQSLRMLRITSEVEGPGLKGSSADAAGAAYWIFSNTPLEGMTKKEVLSLFGDPKTISDYGKEPGTEPDAPLMYRFDTGLGGFMCTIIFQDGTVSAVECTGFS